MKGVQRKVQGKFFARRKGKTEGGDHLGEVAGEAEESLRQDSRAEPGLRRVLFLGGKKRRHEHKNSLLQRTILLLLFFPLITKHGQPASEKSLQRRR